jgi:hypothetical protein
MKSLGDSSRGATSMAATFPKVVFLMVLPALAATLPAQVRSQAASVTLRARVEESVSVRAYPISLPQAEREGDESPAAALHILLDWRLQGARVYRVGYGLEEDDETTSAAVHPGFFSLRQLQAKAAAFSFMSTSSDQPAVLGVWGNADRDPTGAASFLLAVPSRGEATTGTVRITVAVF